MRFYENGIIWASLGLLMNGVVGTESLYQVFREPPVEARPFVRWWWNGDCVEAGEILRELDLLQAAGIGGVEINPIAMPGEAGRDGRPEDGCLEWGSPEWAEMVKVAIDGCEERGMVADLIIGSGWPFGGEFLESGETLQGLGLNTVQIEGPMEFKGNLHALMRPPHTNQAFEGASALEPMFLFLTPKRVESLDSVVDLMKTVEPDGSFSVLVPDGKHLLHIGAWQEAFRSVMHGAPGSAGQVLDHYSRTAVKRYLDKFASSLEPALEGSLGEAGLRALFVDSIELSGANWTTDLSGIFKERRGYTVEPYLPFVIYKNGYAGYDPDYELGGDFSDTVKRVRYDFYATIVEVFLENFVQTYHEWCHEHDCLSRYQAYGAPWLVGMAEGYLIPDIPESNGWIYSPDPYSHGYWVWNKYASSAGHCMDRSIISSESMTNTRGVFRTSLEYIKEHNDMNVVMGINHDVLHGFNYSPPEAGFPGWVRYGTYFNEQNTWWPLLKKWTDYSARLSAVFQKADPRVEVAILHPAADTWSREGLYRGPFQTVPWYSHRLWEPLSQIGCTADYISEEILSKANVQNGIIGFGPMRYKTLILCDVVTLSPHSAKALMEFAEEGGKLIFIGSYPSRSPGLKNAELNDARVRKYIKTVELSHFLPAPPVGSDLLEWTRQLVKTCQIEPAVTIAEPDPLVYQNQYILGEQELYFFVNHSRTEERTINAGFPTGDKLPWRWDAETGERYSYPYAERPNQLKIQLLPLESLLLVFSPAEKALENPPNLSRRIIPGPGEGQQLEETWKAIFKPVREKEFTRVLDKLIDLQSATDPEIAHFSGTVIYETTLINSEPELTLLDLGTVHGISEVILNGHPVGLRWWGRHLYDLKEAIRPGENHLQIRVTTTLLNYVKSLEQNATARRWTARQEPVPSGLLGPVKLLRRQ